MIERLRIVEKIKVYDLAGQCPLIAQVIANEQGIGMYPVRFLLEHFKNSAQALKIGWDKLAERGLA